ncbi:MAG: hypothetical protein ACR5LD_02030 [Symbiopectobacterium sp.]
MKAIYSSLVWINACSYLRNLTLAIAAAITPQPVLDSQALLQATDWDSSPACIRFFSRARVFRASSAAIIVLLSGV